MCAFRDLPHSVPILVIEVEDVAQNGSYAVQGRDIKGVRQKAYSCYDDHLDLEGGGVGGVEGPFAASGSLNGWLVNCRGDEQRE